MKKIIITLLLLTTAILMAACSISFDLFGKEPTPAPTLPPAPTEAPTEAPVQPGPCVIWPGPRQAQKGSQLMSIPAFVLAAVYVCLCVHTRPYPLKMGN